MKCVTSKIIIVISAILLVFASSMQVQAADVAASGGSGDTSAILNQNNTVFSVTVPSSLPVWVSSDGVATFATDASIINNSYGPVIVTAVSVQPINGWSLAAFTTDFTKEKIDLKQFGMQINSDEAATNGGLTLTPANWSSIAGKGSLLISYQANVAIQKTAQAVTIANVVFTVSWDGNGGGGDYTDGQVVRMGTLQINGATQAMPTNPVRDGNVFQYNESSQLTITDTVADKALQFIAVKIDGKQLLVCDRNVVANISWNALNDQNLIIGKEVTIDSQKYKLRVLTGGANKGDPCEWDKMMAAVGTENTIWHWNTIYSWCQETFTGDNRSRALRGYSSAAYWTGNNAATYNPGYGWRPVLEIL